MDDELSGISQPEDAPDVGVKIRLGPPRVVMAAPLGDTSWGSFNFPNLWRLRDGRLVCAVTIGQDEMSSDADYHYLWYISDDEGEHWTHAVVDENEAESFLRERITLSDGRQLYYKPKMVSVDKLGCEPIPRFPGIGWKGMNVYYRLGDMDAECRSLDLYSRGPGESAWRKERAMMDPDIIVPAYKETVLEKDSVLGPTHSAIGTHLRRLIQYVGDDRLPALGIHKIQDDQPPHLHPLDRPGFSIHNASWGVSPEELTASRARNLAIRVQIPSPLGCRLHDYPLLPIMELADGTLNHELLLSSACKRYADHPEERRTGYGKQIQPLQERRWRRDMVVPLQRSVRETRRTPGRSGAHYAEYAPGQLGRDVAHDGR
jgi:hypothetical protein